MLHWFCSVMLSSTNAPDNEPDNEPDADTRPLDELPAGSATAVAERSFLRRHPLAVGIGGAALAVVLVSGLTAWGVGSAVLASYTNAVPAPAASTAPLTRAQGAHRGTAPVRAQVRGIIQAISGATWTVKTRTGVTQTVIVDAATRYGTVKAPAPASEFTVGASVLILEKSEGGRKTAVRVVAAKGGGGTPVPSATPNA